MAGWKHAGASWREKSCPVCSTSFTPHSGAHKFCCEECKGKWQYISGRVTTETQYTKISGNWKRYLSRLLYSGGKKRADLSVDDLIDILEAQNFRCALSGVELTCKLSRGTKAPTNASVDRIIAGGPYTSDNVQLVCRSLNSFRADLTVDQFVWWCEPVAAHKKDGKEICSHG